MSDTLDSWPVLRHSPFFFLSLSLSLSFSLALSRSLSLALSLSLAVFLPGSLSLSRSLSLSLISERERERKEQTSKTQFETVSLSSELKGFRNLNLHRAEGLRWERSELHGFMCCWQRESEESAFYDTPEIYTQNLCHSWATFYIFMGT